MHVHAKTDFELNGKKTAKGTPCMSFKEFAATKKETSYSTLCRRVKSFPLPPVKFRGNRKGAAVNFYDIRELEKWFIETNAKIGC